MNDDRDDLEVVDLVNEDEPQRRPPKPKPPGDRPRGRRPMVGAAIVLALVLVVAALAYARSHDDSASRARDTPSTPSTSLRARSQALAAAFGGSPLLGLPPGQLALTIAGRVWIADIATGDFRPAVRDDRVTGLVAAHSANSVLITGTEPAVLELSSGRLTRTGPVDGLFRKFGTDTWLRARNGVLLRPGFGTPEGNVPLGAVVLAELQAGLLLRPDAEAPAVVRKPGTDPNRLTPVVPATASLIATDATRVAYAACRFSPQCSATRPPLVVSNVVTGAATTVALLDGESPRTGMFSPDGTRLAITLQTPDGQRAAIIDTATGKVLARVSALFLNEPSNGMLLQPLPFTWTNGGEVLLVVQGRPERSERLVSSFRAADGVYIRSFSGLRDLEQVVALDDQPSER